MDACSTGYSVFESFLTTVLMSDSGFAQQQLLQPSKQQSTSWRSLLAGSSSSTTTSSQHMVTPIRAGYSASGFSHNVSARSPIIDTISLPVGNPQAGVGQIRAPAPHLQPYRQWHSFFFFLFSLPSWERFLHKFWREKYCSTDADVSSFFFFSFPNALF